MPFRSILRAARTSRSLTAPHAGHTHVRSRNDSPLLMQPHSQVLEEGYHLSILCLEAAEGYPVDVDLETQGFYRCNDAGTLPGECADFIFHKCND